jgi:hypothetical protein
MHVIADVLFTRSVREQSAKKLHYEMIVRRKDDWLDIGGKSFLLDAAQGKSTQDRLVHTSQYVNIFGGQQKKDPTAVMFSKKGSKHLAENISDRWIALTFIDGYCPGSGGRRVPELMLEMEQLEHVGDAEVGGKTCHIVAGQSKDGKFTLWLAPEFGFLPLKAAYEKGPNDLMNDEPLSRRKHAVNGPDKPALRMTSWSETIDQVTIAAFGSAHVPTAAHLSDSTRFDNGAERASETTVTRDHIELNPSFEGTDAFRVDVPEGFPVSNLDDADSGVRYVWHNGTPVLQSVTFEGAPAQYQHDSQWSALIVAGWLILGITVFLVGIWLVYRVKRGVRGG